MSMNLGTSGVKSDINVTPFVDIVLVLLIIFMVVTPMLQRGKSVELPKAKHAVAGQGAEPAFISVTKDGNVFVEQEKKPATQEDVMVAMRAAAEAGRRVMIKADTDAEYGKVRPVLDWASKAKLKGVSLAAEELKGAK